MLTINCNCIVVDGVFGEWSDWTACTAECGGGDQTRSRDCNNPAPNYGGLDCEGAFVECQRCNTDMCPTQNDLCPAA